MSDASQNADDREQVRDLYARYAITIDNGQYHDWVGCFTEDGVFDSARFGHYQGQKELTRFAAIHHDSLGSTRVRHMISNVLFELTGDTGRGSCYLTYFQCRDGKVSLAAIGHYEDRLRKVNGRWLFQSRQVCIDAHG